MDLLSIERDLLTAVFLATNDFSSSQDVRHCQREEYLIALCQPRDSSVFQQLLGYTAVLPPQRPLPPPRPLLLLLLLLLSTDAQPPHSSWSPTRP